ncbi:hypothetical protein CYMTET_16598 [Cymbomonas tetramitiformis]|uniref:Uncharacterized protein n=1 Tax=Cymbomonas tetramitiformis TaxID=36881 RepID=A0AAE0GC35_9CHLO|nr:hypothetical protein CYMTET_16598 [Cymbomonas tetramitiformis]
MALHTFGAVYNVSSPRHVFDRLTVGKFGRSRCIVADQAKVLPRKLLLHTVCRSKGQRRTGRFPTTHLSPTPKEWRDSAAELLTTKGMCDTFQEDAHSGGYWILLTGRHKDWYDAFVLEAEACSPGARALSCGLFATRGSIPEHCLQRMAGLRAEAEVLAAATNPEDLLQQLKGLSLVLASDEKFQLNYENIGRVDEQIRWQSPRFLAAIADQVDGEGVLRGKEGGLSISHRFVVVEYDKGYIFGRVRYAPPELPEGADFSKKPHNFCAGLPPELAAVAVSIALGNRDLRREDGGRRRLLDPCCGSGTVLFEAWKRGMDVRCVHVGKGGGSSGRNMLQ